MKRQELLRKSSITERTLRSLLSQAGLDIEAKEIPDPLAEKLIKGESQQPKASPSPQLNQGQPTSSLEELQQVNAQNLVLSQQLEESALIAEVHRLGNQGTYVGAMAVAAYQQNLLRQIASGLGEWSQVANDRSKKITSISLQELQQLQQQEAQKLIGKNSKMESPQLLAMFAPGTLVD